MEMMTPNFTKLPKDWRPNERHIKTLFHSTHSKLGCIFFNLKKEDGQKNLKIKRIFFKKRKHSAKHLIYIWFTGELIDLDEYTIKSNCGRPYCINPNHLIKEKCLLREEENLALKK